MTSVAQIDYGCGVCGQLLLESVPRSAHLTDVVICPSCGVGNEGLSSAAWRGVRNLLSLVDSGDTSDGVCTWFPFDGDGFELGIGARPEPFTRSDLSAFICVDRAEWDTRVGDPRDGSVFVPVDVYVPDDLRRQGLGTRLYLAAIDLLAGYGERLYGDLRQTVEATALWESLVRDGVAERYGPLGGTVAWPRPGGRFYRSAWVKNRPRPSRLAREVRADVVRLLRTGLEAAVEPISREGCETDLWYDRQCVAVCWLIQERLAHSGIPAVMVEGNCYAPRRKFDGHAWLEFADGTIVDPTSAQLFLPECLVLPQGDDRRRWYHPVFVWETVSERDAFMRLVGGQP